MKIILSHITALDLHRAIGGYLRSMPRVQTEQVAAPGAPTADELKFTRAFLESRRWAALDTRRIHYLVGRRKDRRAASACHLCSHPIGGSHLIPIGPGIFITDLPLTMLQLAGMLSELELIKTLFAVCGTYLGATADGRGPKALPQHEPFTSIEAIESCLKEHEGARGSLKLRRALAYVRNGARSPMETALMMLLALPRSQGGLGIKDIEMDWRIDVVGRARELTRRGYFLCDIYLPKYRMNIEYNGAYHDEDAQQAIDEERRRALEDMGYKLMVFTRHSLMNQAGFERAITSLMHMLGKRGPCMTPEFRAQQERLRRFVLQSS